MAPKRKALAMRKAWVWMSCLVVCAFAALAVATPANAAVEGITSEYNGPCNAGGTSCTTGSLQAGPSHQIAVEALTFVGGGNFKLIDSANGVVVWQKGLGNFQDQVFTVSGLFSSYFCTVRNASPGAGCALHTH
jgi:hypothetical protein